MVYGTLDDWSSRNGDIYIYLKNRKSGMTVIQSFKRLTCGYLLLEIPIGLCYYWAINVRM